MPVRSLDRFDPVYRYATTGKVQLTVHGLDQLKEVETLAGRLGVALPVHVQLDTGMSRGGCLADEATRVVEGVRASRRLTLAGLMTHFASAGTDEAFTLEQAQRFDHWLTNLGDRIDRRQVLTHLSATSGVFRSARHHGGLVRVGQGLFGYAPNDGGDGNELGRDAAKLEPALRWTTAVVHEAEIPAGWPVGYGSTWRPDRPTRIALLPVGYADGYPRSLGNTGSVTFSGMPYERRGGSDEPRPRAPRRRRHAPIVGRVSMDQITVDVTDVPSELTRPGMEVELISRDPAAPTSLPTLARTAGTVPHDLMCSIGSRVQRLYAFAPEMENEGPIARLGAG
jgi:alanine racemase